MNAPVQFQNRTMFRGDTLAWDLEIGNPSTGGPLNLTSTTIWFTAKHNYVDPDIRAAIKCSTDNDGVVITDVVRGKARVTIDPIKTRSFPDGPVKLVYDIQIKDAGGAVTTIEAGTITVWPDVSRAI